MRYRSKIESCFGLEAHVRSERLCVGNAPASQAPQRAFDLSGDRAVAKAVAYNLRRIATLEELLGQEISFTKGHYFEPMPEAWVSPESTPSLLTRPDLLDDAA